MIGAGAYSVFADITGDGQINALDLAAVKQRLGRRTNTLPEPASVSVASQSITQEVLFGAQPIL